MQSLGLAILIHFIVFTALTLGLQGVLQSVAQIWLGNIGDSKISAYQTYRPSEILFFLFGSLLLVLTLAGWLDDHYGTEEIKGLKGHFSVLFRNHQMTTGLMKALLGFSISLFVSFYMATTSVEWLWFTSLLLLSIHSFNLFDVRPGRTIKTFIFFLLTLIPFLSMNHVHTLVLPVSISILILFHFDRNRKAMLGDVGSNVIGGIFGFLLILTHTFALQGVFFFTFTMLGIIAEKGSLSKIIEKNPWLSKWDSWGIR